MNPWLALYIGAMPAVAFVIGWHMAKRDQD